MTIGELVSYLNSYPNHVKVELLYKEDNKDIILDGINGLYDTKENKLSITLYNFKNKQFGQH
jgi:hypothetical protein